MKIEITATHAIMKESNIMYFFSQFEKLSHRPTQNYTDIESSAFRGLRIVARGKYGPRGGPQ